MTFRLGQKVALKNGKPWKNINGLTVPVVGAVYSIRKIMADDEGGALLLNEIRNPRRWHQDGFGEATWDANEFRPVIEPKKQTDISVFTKMLDGQGRELVLSDNFGEGET
jgi:hypothetical protein